MLGKVSKIKCEEVENARQAQFATRPSEITLKQQAIRDQLLREPTDSPRGGLPRFVFKKGSTPPSICTVMGGNPTVVYPKVKNPKAWGFVKSGEAYFVGRRNFNPWAPAFAGDQLGFVVHAIRYVIHVRVT